MTKLIMALDTPSIHKAEKIMSATFTNVWGFKIGPKLFYPNFRDPKLYDIVKLSRHLFLDMKFHDIPETVRGAVSGINDMNPRMFTIHATGGYKMMQAAVDERNKTWPTSSPPLVVAVTILTSIDDGVWGRMFNVPKEYIFDNLVDEAVYSGVDAVVCSGQEVGWIKNKYPDLITVVPGTRSLGVDTNDQARVVTPRQAADDGADYLVIGREVADAADPGLALEKIVDSLK